MAKQLLANYDYSEAPMAKYHFNPETGEPGVCKAEISCPFGLPLESHSYSLREAAVASEEHMKKLAGGSFGLIELIEPFDEWKVRKDASKVLEPSRKKNSVDLNAPQPQVESYRALMPTGMAAMGDYARAMGLDLEETRYFAAELDGSSLPSPSERKEIILEGIRKHVNEAAEKNGEIDATLNKSNYFKSPSFKYRESGTVLETIATYDGEDVITRVDEKGKANFEVYDHAEGETARATSTEGWTAGVGTWMQEFKSHQDHLYLRVLWENEQKRRNDRYLAIGVRLLDIQ